MTVVNNPNLNIKNIILFKRRKIKERLKLIVIIKINYLKSNYNKIITKYKLKKITNL